MNPTNLQSYFSSIFAFIYLIFSLFSFQTSFFTICSPALAVCMGLRSMVMCSIHSQVGLCKYLSGKRSVSCVTFWTCVRWVYHVWLLHSIMLCSCPIFTPAAINSPCLPEKVNVTANQKLCTWMSSLSAGIWAQYDNLGFLAQCSHDLNSQVMHYICNLISWFVYYRKKIMKWIKTGYSVQQAENFLWDGCCHAVGLFSKPPTHAHSKEESHFDPWLPTLCLHPHNSPQWLLNDTCWHSRREKWSSFVFIS